MKYLIDSINHHVRLVNNNGAIKKIKLTNDQYKVLLSLIGNDRILFYQISRFTKLSRKHEVQKAIFELCLKGFDITVYWDGCKLNTPVWVY